MPDFLSPTWIDALRDAAQQSARPTPAAPFDPFVIEQTVILADGSTTYHLIIGAESIDVRAGRAADPSIMFTTDYRTAASINRGVESALAAFMDGRLRIGGDVGALLAHTESISTLDDVFALVRTDTTYVDA